jgi:hypothetical protein
VNSHLVRFLRRLMRSFTFRFHAFLYKKGVVFAQLKLKVHKSTIEILDRPCCKSELFKDTFKRRNLSAFSQLNFAATSDVILANSISGEDDYSSCKKCVHKLSIRKQTIFYVDLESIRRKRTIFEYLKEVADAESILLIGFTEGKNLSLKDLNPFLNLPFLRVYVENLEIETRKRVYPLPIGLRDGFETVPTNFPMSEKFYKILENDGDITRFDEIFSHFSIWTHPERSELNKIISKLNGYRTLTSEKNAEFKLPTGDISPNNYFNEIIRHSFVLAPRGGGVDTHRFYEALRAKAIPIVKKSGTAFDAIYETFPCVAIDDWEELATLTFDKRVKSELLGKIYELHNNTNSLRISATELQDLFV